jgi:DNA topoisomerase IA
MEKDLDKIRDGKIDFEKYVIDFWNKIKSLL